MINEAIIHSVMLHKVGGKAEGEMPKVSKSPLNLDDEMCALLTTFFITPFKTGEYFNLSDSENNEVCRCVSAIFDNVDNLAEESVKLADILHECNEGQSKSGEFYVAYFRECVVDGEPVEALGLFKSENREIFLKIYPAANNYIVECEEGISIRKPDKGCMIFNTERENGYLVALIDGSKNADWREGFLKIKPYDNPYSKTRAMMQACKDFVNDELPEQFEINRADQIDLLNRSMQYFKSNEAFERPRFEQEVLQQPELIESFREFDDKYRDEKNIPAEMTFEIAPQAVKKNSKILKSVLKLDKNFHIYIHGDRSLIEKCEEDGRKYYKVFYETEN